MRQKLVAFGDDFYIENEQGQKVFKVDGKALRVRDTLVFKDMQGNKLCQIQERKVRVKNTMKVEDSDGKDLALIKKAIITPVRDRWTVKIEDGPDLDVEGTSWTTSTASERAARRWPRSRKSGSGCATPTAWRWPRARTTSSFWL